MIIKTSSNIRDIVIEDLELYCPNLYAEGHKVWWKENNIRCIEFYGEKIKDHYVIFSGSNRRNMLNIAHSKEDMFNITYHLAKDFAISLIDKSEKDISYEDRAKNR